MDAEYAQAPTASLRQNTIFRIGVFTRALFSFMKKKPLGGFGVIVLAAMTFLAIFAELISPSDPLLLDFGNSFALPFTEGHILGTDPVGRDMLSRLIYGSRISMYVGFTTVIIGGSIGAFLGVSSGYFRGWYDQIVQRIMDAILAFPLIVLALALVAALGPSTTNVVWAITIPMVPRMARVVRASVLSLRDSDFITAAIAAGASNFRIMVFHVLPNVMAPIIIVATANLGIAVVTEASLGYLGLGTQEPTPSWGVMLGGPLSEHAQRNPWNVIFPGVALSIAVFAFNLLGDSMRDVLDPRLRQR